MMSSTNTNPASSTMTPDWHPRLRSTESDEDAFSYFFPNPQHTAERNQSPTSNSSFSPPEKPVHSASHSPCTSPSCSSFGKTHTIFSTLENDSLSPTLSLPFTSPSAHPLISHSPFQKPNNLSSAHSALGLSPGLKREHDFLNGSHPTIASSSPFSITTRAATPTTSSSTATHSSSSLAESHISESNPSPPSPSPSPHPPATSPFTSPVRKMHLLSSRNLPAPSETVVLTPRKKFKLEIAKRTALANASPSLPPPHMAITQPSTQAVTPEHSPNLAPCDAPIKPTPFPANVPPPPLPIIHSEDVVKRFPKKYSPWFDDFESSDPSLNTTSISTSVELVYCARLYRENFSLLRPKQITKIGLSILENEYDPVADLIDTIRQLIENTLICAPESVLFPFLDKKTGVLRKLERSRNRKNFHDFVLAVATFNKEYAACKKEGYVLGYHKKRLKTATDAQRKSILQAVALAPCFSLVSHVLYQAYARAVAPQAEVLQKYKAFSNTVYGEINPNFVELILKHVELDPEDTFLDLGSGIGNVVLHMAARAQCRACGIEIQEAVAALAQGYANEFRARMKYFNRRMGDIQLEHGDFLTHPMVPPLLSKSRVIFVNNYVFSPELNRSLLDLFLDLNEGAVVVSLKAFASPDLRISSRNIHSVEALFDVKAVEFGSGYVSWTDHGGKFYIHTMNRKRVQKFAKQFGHKNLY